MSDDRKCRYSRILHLYTKLLNGGVIDKDAEAERFRVSVRSIQRDLNDLRCFFSEDPEGAAGKEIAYDAGAKGYRLRDKW